TREEFGEAIRELHELGFVVTIDLLHDSHGTIQIGGETYQDLWQRWYVDRTPQACLDQDYGAELIAGRRPAWRCRAGSRFLYVDEFGLVQFCSAQRGPSTSRSPTTRTGICGRRPAPTRAASEGAPCCASTGCRLWTTGRCTRSHRSCGWPGGVRGAARDARDGRHTASATRAPPIHFSRSRSRRRVGHTPAAGARAVEQPHGRAARGARRRVAARAVSAGFPGRAPLDH